jgi:hypothetical protein
LSTLLNNHKAERATNKKRERDFSIKQANKKLSTAAGRAAAVSTNQTDCRHLRWRALFRVCAATLFPKIPLSLTIDLTGVPKPYITTHGHNKQGGWGSNLALRTKLLK